MLIHQKIASLLEELSPSQKAMAQYLLDHGEQAAFMTARQLADTLGQSDATVVRFARALGYEGFSEMRLALRSGLLERVGSSGMLERNAPSEEGNLQQAVADADIALCTESARLNAPETAAAIADRLIAARRIWVTGHGTTYPMAAYLAMNLNQCLDKAQIFNVEHGDLADRFRSVGSGDVFVGIGYVRYLPYTINILRLAREAGADVIAITDRKSSPLARLASHSLFAARATTSPAWWSQAGTMSLTNWLVALVVTRNARNVERQLRRSDEEWRRLGHWNSPGNSEDEPSLEDRLKAQLPPAKGRRKPSTDQPLENP